MNKKRIIIIAIIITIFLILGLVFTKIYDFDKDEKSLFVVTDLTVADKLAVNFNIKNISNKNQDLDNYKVCYLDKDNNLIIYSESLSNIILQPKETTSIIKVSNTDISVIDHTQIVLKNNECSYNKDLRSQYENIQVETGITKTD